MHDCSERLAAVDDGAEERFFRALRPGLRRERFHHGLLGSSHHMSENRTVAGASMAWRMLAALALAEFLGMTLWFSATAAAPAIIAE